MTILQAALLPSALSADNGLGQTPPMGWRSWNCDRGAVSDAKIRTTIDAIVARTRKVDGVLTSLADVGYGRVGVDDGWQACGTGWAPDPKDKLSFHDKWGTPLINGSTFPSLRDMVTYGHSKNVKMGWYLNNCICMDEYTLQEDPAWAQQSYWGDITMVVEAHFDGVKIDNCGDDRGAGFIARVAAINASGHALLVENSNQGKMSGPGGNARGNPLNDSYCPYNFFRSGGDIGPDFANVISKLQRTVPYLGNASSPYISRPGCWAYPDMLEVGNFGGAAQERCASGGLPEHGGVGAPRARTSAEWYATPAGELAIRESRTHFGAWCVVSSPLILGLDVTDSARLDSVWEIITNREAIAVNQAWAQDPGALVVDAADHQVWCKVITRSVEGEATSIAALIFNRGDGTLNSTTVPLSTLGFDVAVASGRSLKARDIWQRADAPDAVRGAGWAVPALLTHDSAFMLFELK